MDMKKKCLPQARRLLTIFPQAGCLLTILFLMAGCSTRELRYVSDAPRDNAMPITNSYKNTITPGDILYVHVDAPSPEAVLQFNEETNRRPMVDDVASRSRITDATPHGYTVSNTGDIIMPIIGRVHAGGLTLEQLADTIETTISSRGYISNPQVTVRLMNFTVTVIGEVRRPMVITSPSERLTIFEAIAMCGDVTMYGIRSCVSVVRTVNDVQTIDTVDLTSKEILNSPYYYLHQNDIVYVEPNEKRKRQAWRDPDWVRYMTTGVSGLRLAYTIMRYYRSINRINNQ